jgi:hypothetical protein
MSPTTISAPWYVSNHDQCAMVCLQSRSVRHGMSPTTISAPRYVSNHDQYASVCLQPRSVRHGMSPTTLFTWICVSRMFARYSRKGSLSIAQLSPHSLTPSWNHYYNQRTTGDSNDDGHSTGCTKEAPLDAFLDHRQP